MMAMDGMMVFMEGTDTGLEDSWSFSSSAWNIIGLPVSSPSQPLSGESGSNRMEKLRQPSRKSK